MPSLVKDPVPTLGVGYAVANELWCPYNLEAVSLDGEHSLHRFNVHSRALTVRCIDEGVAHLVEEGFSVHVLSPSVRRIIFEALIEHLHGRKYCAMKR